MSRVQTANRPLFRPAKAFPCAPDEDIGQGHLEADGRGADIQRRRAECSRLGPCERAWVAEHGSAQARCPVDCSSFVRAAARPVETSSGGRVALKVRE